MKNILFGILVLVAMGLSFVGGMYYQKPQQLVKTAVVVPSPTPDTSKFNSDKVTVKSFDGKELVYILENKTEKTISDVSDIKVWLPPKAQGEKATETNWKAVKVGIQLTIASDKTTGQIVGVLVL